MVTRSEFKSLEQRVSILETHVETKSTAILTNITLAPTNPITIVIEEESFVENVNSETVIPGSLYKRIEKDDYHILVRLYYHGEPNVLPKTVTNSTLNYYEYLYIRPYYNVLILTHTPAPLENLTPKLNTKVTTNIQHYTDTYKRASLYFGFANDDNPVTPDNLFVHGRTTGVFFIINDKMHKRVSTYVSTHQTDIVTVRTGLANGNIDIYKSAHLGTQVNVEIVLKEHVVRGRSAIDDDDMQPQKDSTKQPQKDSTKQSHEDRNLDSSDR